MPVSANLKMLITIICSLISTRADYSICIVWCSSHRTPIDTYVRDFCYVNVAVDARERKSIFSLFDGVRVQHFSWSQLKQQTDISCFFFHFIFILFSNFKCSDVIAFQFKTNIFKCFSVFFILLEKVNKSSAVDLRCDLGKRYID